MVYIGSCISNIVFYIIYYMTRLPVYPSILLNAKHWLSESEEDKLQCAVLLQKHLNAGIFFKDYG